MCKADTLPAVLLLCPSLLGFPEGSPGCVTPRWSLTPNRGWRVILQELREHGEKKKRPREEAGDNDDTEGALGVRNKVAGGKMKKKRKGR